MRIALGVLIHVALAGVLLFLLLPEGLPPASAGRAPEDPERLFDDIAENHRVEVSKRPGCLFGRQEEVWKLYLKGRLLTLSYPNIMEGVLLTRAADSSRSEHMRSFSIALLGQLYRAGWSSSEATLHRIARDPHPYLSGEALRELAEVDATGRFLDLYRDKCPLQVWPAFDAVSYWHDPTTVAEMRRIAGNHPSNSFPESTLRLRAEETLSRLEILASPECNQTLEGILKGSHSSHRFRWALKVARIRPLPGLLSILRRRLDEAETPLSPDASDAERHDYALVIQAGVDPARELSEGRRLSMSMDEHFDDALIAYAELGGPLNEGERLRLTVFGFVGDPRTRLEEMLNAGK